ncbi:MAG: hypothetical protein A2782_00685 [Candidatus Blackburnbacteria bacterium RIFCSPHIGHO2_01_FULL_43_15b]|uniref:Uncharacterized protein n=1 Tax=Candidatus Blackburnbacteria bacterium RIFCSPHIGHO2_01_FULL_43_15b TaxID=1797513 RepID=A0A1G1UYV6_9BACT|nr:MAG: hypothetical protein A2782_00685 [Candidatus Blackburnbacteria bacterium RIFCSPHIGHO2_01_FULL_43_15b]
MVKCENSACGKELKRAPAQVSPHNYCSHSCAAKVVNSTREKEVKICPNCLGKFTGDKKYCSLKCIPKRESQYSKEVILDTLRKFVKKNKRISTKKGMNKLYRATRELFGTWNNAIKTAGFEPNPVMFAKKHMALDGHKCDSLAERIIDDWLFRRKIPHKRNIPLFPKGKLDEVLDFLIDKPIVKLD